MTVRDVLDVIDEFLAGARMEDFVKLWSILTALRGPDVGIAARSVKSRTTAVIRTKAFPRTAHSVWSGVHLPIVEFAYGDKAFPTPEEVDNMDVDDHFRDHILTAIDSLDRIKS